MSQFSGRAATTRVQTPLRTTDERAVTHEGAIGARYDERTELYLLAVSMLVGRSSFYEGADERLARLADLTRKVSDSDPEFVAKLVPFVRREMFIRSASTVMAVEAARSGAGKGVIRSAAWRADEPAEMLGYHLAFHGRKLPAAVKRGIAQAAVDLYDQRAALKYDGKSRGVRMADVIELTHPRPQSAEQSALFKYLLDQRHHGDGDASELSVLTNALAWRAADEPGLPPPFGITWEEVLSRLGSSKEVWEAVAPKLGYMALLRNLRNLDQAGIGDALVAQLATKIANPDEVAGSRQFPLRFLSAWDATESMRWGAALELALEHSVRNVPALTGRTLILIDCSGSMQGTWSGGRASQPWRTASIFGLALARQAESADVIMYSNDGMRFEVDRLTSLLRALEKVKSLPLWGGTNTYGTLLQAYFGHDRVVILTDEQAHSAARYGVSQVDVDAVPAPIYTFNLVGYPTAQFDAQGGRYTFGGGLTDANFRVLELLERSKDASWDELLRSKQEVG